MITISFAVFPGPYITPVKCILTEYEYVMMIAIMLSIYPSSDMTPVVHKHLFSLRKYIQENTKKTDVEGLSIDIFLIVDHIVFLLYYRFSCSFFLFFSSTTLLPRV